MTYYTNPWKKEVEKEEEQICVLIIFVVVVFLVVVFVEVVFKVVVFVFLKFANNRANIEF